jgi:hypothetical protein
MLSFNLGLYINQSFKVVRNGNKKSDSRFFQSDEGHEEICDRDSRKAVSGL